MLVKLNLPAKSYIKATILTHKFDFPMRFFLNKKKAKIEVNVSFNSIPTSFKYEKKYFKNNFYVNGPNDGRVVKFVGLMVISDQILGTNFGCAFSYVKNTNKNFDVNNPEHLKDKTFESVKTKGINYSSILDFSDMDRGKKRKKKKFDKLIQKIQNRRRDLDIVKKNKMVVQESDYVEKKNKDFYEKFSKEMGRVKKAKEKKEKLLREKIEEIKSRKTRHEIAKEKREIMIMTLLQILVDKAKQTAYTRLFKVVEVFMQINQKFLDLKRQKKSVRTLMIIASLTAKFIVPLRRFKKSSIQGSLERTKM